MNLLKLTQSFLAILVLVITNSAVNADDFPQPFTAVYDVHHSGARVGETTVILEAQEDGVWSMSSNTRPRGLAAFVRSGNVVEKSLFRWNENSQLEGLSYDFKDGSRKGKRNSWVYFNWNDAKASSHYKKEDAELELNAPIGDRLSLQALLMRDLTRGELKPHYDVINKNQLKTYGFEELDSEVIDTRAGRFNTLKVHQQRAGSSRSSILWLAIDHGFAPVKLIQYKDGKARTALTLKKLTQ